MKKGGRNAALLFSSVGFLIETDVDIMPGFIAPKPRDGAEILAVLGMTA